MSTERAASFAGNAREASLASLENLAVVAAEMYDRVENPGRYGDDGSMAAVLEWFPKLRDALADAGLLL